MTDSQRSELTAFLPNPGYFIAGGVAGVISRTATAPLDRLKVYLIANTGTSTTNFAAVKGSPLKAVRGFGRPLIDACKVLWSTGGVRSLFAGRFVQITHSRAIANMTRQRNQRHQGDARVSHQVRIL